MTSETRNRIPMTAVRRERDALRVHSYAHNEPSDELWWLDEVRHWPRVRAAVEGMGEVDVFTPEQVDADEVQHGFVLPFGLSEDDIGELAPVSAPAEE